MEELPEKIDRNI
jgi:hypothetical protein